MKILAFDCGQRRTGVAFVDTENNIPVALDTLTSVSRAQLHASIKELAEKRDVEMIVLGLPLLLSGEEGAQVKEVKIMGSLLEQDGFSVEYIDERFTSLGAINDSDGDARAACEILNALIARKSLT